MTGRFIPFQYRELKQDIGDLSATASAFTPPSFETQAVASAKDTAHNVRTAKFVLDARVASAIGVEEEQRARESAREKAELEKRWQVLKGQCEVEGFKEGLERGRKEAYAAELPRIEAKLGELNALIEEIGSMREQIFVANEQFLMQLMAKIIRTILLKEASRDPDYLKRVVKSILDQTGCKENLRILVSEKDIEVIGDLSAFLHKEFGKLSNTVIEAHPDIPRSGCKIETRFGVVDATLQTQIDNVLSTLSNE